MDKSVSGTVFSVTILFYVHDLPGRSSAEQAEANEQELQRIKNMMTGMLVMLPLEDNWEMRVEE